MRTGRILGALRGRRILFVRIDDILGQGNAGENGIVASMVGKRVEVVTRSRRRAGHVNKWHLAGGRYLDHERLLSKNALDAKAVIAGDVSKELLERLSNEHRRLAVDRPQPVRWNCTHYGYYH